MILYFTAHLQHKPPNDPSGAPDGPVNVGNSAVHVEENQLQSDKKKRENIRLMTKNDMKWNYALFPDEGLLKHK